MNNTLRFALSTALLLSGATPALATSWDLDGAHSDVSFKVRHMAVSYTRGQFQTVKGTLQLDERDITRSKVTIEIDVASLSTDNDKRDGHLRSPDFFDAAKFPKLTFVSTSVRRAGKGLAVQGNLTMHGVTRPVTLSVGEISETVKGPYGFLRKGFAATATIDRRDFGLTWSQTMETGGLVVGHDVKIAIEAEFLRKPDGKKS